MNPSQGTRKVWNELLHFLLRAQRRRASQPATPAPSNAIVPGSGTGATLPNTRLSIAQRVEKISTLVKPEAKAEVNKKFWKVVAPLPGVVKVLVTLEPLARNPMNEMGTSDDDGELGSAKFTEVNPKL